MQKEFKSITGIEFDVISGNDTTGTETRPLGKLIFIKEDSPDDLAVNDIPGGYVDTLIAVVALHATDVKTLILDEIGRGLYPYQRTQLRTILLSKKEVSILYTTHNPEMIIPGSQSIYHLSHKNGEVKALAMDDDRLNGTHLFKSLENKVLLFSSTVIFVEGKDDQVLLQVLNECFINRVFRGRWKRWKEIRATIIEMGGNNSTATMMRVASAFGVNAVTIVDKDAVIKKLHPTQDPSKIKVDQFLTTNNHQLSDRDLLLQYEKWKSDCKKNAVYQPLITLEPKSTLVEDKLSDWNNSVTDTTSDNERQKQILEFYQGFNIFAWESGDLEAVIRLTDSKTFSKKGLASHYSHEQIQKLVEKMENNSDMNRLLDFLATKGMIHSLPEDLHEQ